MRSRFESLAPALALAALSCADPSAPEASEIPRISVVTSVPRIVEHNAGAFDFELELELDRTFPRAIRVLDASGTCAAIDPLGWEGELRPGEPRQVQLRHGARADRSKRRSYQVRVAVDGRQQPVTVDVPVVMWSPPMVAEPTARTRFADGRMEAGIRLESSIVHFLPFLFGRRDAAWTRGRRSVDGWGKCVSVGDYEYVHSAGAIRMTCWVPVPEVVAETRAGGLHVREGDRTYSARWVAEDRPPEDQ